MALAVKNTKETSSARKKPVSVPVASLLGVVYVLASLVLVFWILPTLWWSGWQSMGIGDPTSGGALLVILGVAAIFGLSYVGVKFYQSGAPVGTRAGVVLGLVGVLLVLLLARWASIWIEHWAYSEGWFGQQTGIILTAAVTGLLLAGLIAIFLRPGLDKQLAQLEEQGWFSATFYKPGQGHKVRRGTILGILVLAAAGAYQTYLTLQTVPNEWRNWTLEVPFTGEVTITNRGDTNKSDAAKFIDEMGLAEKDPLVVDRYTLQRINDKVKPEDWVRITYPGNSEFKVGSLVPRDRFDKEVKNLKDKGDAPPVGADPTPASGMVSFQTITLLPAIRFSVPFLLLGIALWLAWRLVNYPLFADFLVATEAELNKVSWTTQRRLVQDTIVVLVTLVLMAAFLFTMDQVWRTVLGWKPVGVLRIPDNPEQNKSVDEKNW